MEILNNFGLIVGVGSLIVGALVYLYSTAKRGRQDIIRQDNSDLRASNQEMRTEKVGLEATIKEQRDSINHLRDIATQTPAVTKLIDMNSQIQRQTSEQHQQVITELSRLAAQIGSLAKEFSGVAKAISASYQIREEKNEKSRQSR